MPVRYQQTHHPAPVMGVKRARRRPWTYVSIAAAVVLGTLLLQLTVSGREGAVRSAQSLRYMGRGGGGNAMMLATGGERDDGGEDSDIGPAPFQAEEDEGAVTDAAAEPKRTQTHGTRHQNHHSFAFEDDTERAARVNSTVVILTTVKNSIVDLPRYFRDLMGVEYDKQQVSVGLLVSDSTDGSWEYLQEQADRLTEAGFRRATILRKDFNFDLSQAARHSREMQKERRSVIAKARNYLVQHALDDEDWVLWLDVDVTRYPKTVLQDMQLYDKDILVAHCLYADGVYDLNNWQETEKSLQLGHDLGSTHLMLEGYAGMDTYRKRLDEFRNIEDIVPLDGVGGTTLMIKANLHREGLVFPTYVLDNCIETEGLAKLAKRMGYHPYGLPNYHVYHA